MPRYVWCILEHYKVLEITCEGASLRIATLVSSLPLPPGRAWYVTPTMRFKRLRKLVDDARADAKEMCMPIVRLYTDDVNLTWCAELRKQMNARGEV